MVVTTMRTLQIAFVLFFVMLHCALRSWSLQCTQVLRHRVVIKTDDQHAAFSIVHSDIKGSKASKNTIKRREREMLARKQASESFSQFYEQQYGKDRWMTLLAALQRPVRYCAMGNKFADQGAMQALLGICVGESVPFLSTIFSNVYVKAATTMLPVAAVKVISGDGTTGQFVAEFGSHYFDRVLVDAPCSSERHVLHSESELLNWSAGRSRNNAKRQLQLLQTALRLCRVGGRVVYSTCSISRLENDEVVARAVNKANNYFDRRACSEDPSKAGPAVRAVVQSIRHCISRSCSTTDKCDNSTNTDSLGSEKEFYLPLGEPTELG